MSNNKKQNNNQPGDRGMFYDSKKCFLCGKLIWGSSPKNHRSAAKDCYFKMKAHQEQHRKEKEGKQLKLSIPGRESKQSQTIDRVTLRGQEKSV